VIRALSWPALGLTFAAAGSSAAAEAPASAEKPGASEVSRRRVAVSLGFSHWFGPTFGSPDGFTTPMVAVGVRPALSFLEIRARYTRSTSAAAPRDTAGGEPVRGLVGFASLELLVSRELRVGRHALNAFAGPAALLDHAGGSSVGYGFGVALGVEYTIRTGLAQGHAAGPFLGARQVFYVLPDDRFGLGDARRDAQIDLGLLTTLF
jgi:hypothetical protein